MIGVDTNILVRTLVGDTPDETRAALAFLGDRSPDDAAFVGAIVLVELVWVLQRAYGYKPDAIFAALDGLFESANVEIENAVGMELAIATARRERADIADCIIAATAITAGATKTVTFDKKAASRIPGMERLA